jgi:glycosyltransferase involved in cell wall biosynthesis
VLEHPAAKGRPSPNSLISGFRVDIPLPRIERVQNHKLTLRVRLANDEVIDLHIGSLTLLPGYPTVWCEADGPEPPVVTGESPLVAICLPTYNPPLRYLEEQLASVVRQAYENWICIINDDCSDERIYDEIKGLASQDGRFIVSRNEARLGVYHNIEKCLSLVPGHASFVALCDQDDIWFPDKLETLLTVLNQSENVWLAYSDMEIVDQNAGLISPTYWTTRKNNYRNLSALLLVNTITGAASLFRAELISYLLPFPAGLGGVYHDHWIGCTAGTIGRIEYANRPLHQYRQHSSNVIGHSTPRPVHFLPLLRGIVHWSLLSFATKANFGS